MIYNIYDKLLKNIHVFFEDEKNIGFYWLLIKNGIELEIYYGKPTVLFTLTSSNFYKIRNNDDLLNVLKIKKNDFFEKMELESNKRKYIELID